MTQAIEALHKAERKATLGDLTLLGSAGVHTVAHVLISKTDVPNTDPVFRFFQMRRRGWADAAKLRDEHPDSLVGHLSAYSAAAQRQDDPQQFEAFLKEYNESPLVIAAAWFHGAWGGKPESWLRLYEEPRWRGTAVLMSAGRVGTPEHRAKLSEAFKLWLELAGRSEDAWLYLSTLIDQKPKDANSYYHVGYWYLTQKDLDTAQQYYATAFTWDTANPRWLVERAKVFAKSEDGKMMGAK